MEKSVDTLEDALQSFQEFTTKFSGIYSNIFFLISYNLFKGSEKKFNNKRESHSFPADSKPSQNMTPSSQRSFKSEAVVNEIKKKIASFQVSFKDIE